MAEQAMELLTQRQVQRARDFWRRARLCVQETLATVPEVLSVLASVGDGERQLVSILSDGSDEVILRLADQELALMDALDAGFDFRCAGPETRADYEAAGYVVIMEREHDAHAGAAPAAS